MNVSRTLAGLLSSSSQAAKWHHLLRAPTGHQSCSSISTAATAKLAPRKTTRESRHHLRWLQTSTEPAPPEDKCENGGFPPQAPAKPGEPEEATRPPKPSEIPWQVKVANSVHLIGHLGSPPQLGVSASGAYTAVSVLFHEKTHDLPQFWIPIVFQGDLAQIAACNLREKDYVYVTGQLAGASQVIDSNVETGMQVMVHSISHVLELQPEKKHDRRSGADSNSANAKKLGESVVGYWSDLLENPQNWWDNREDKLNGKINPKRPDFTHKDTRRALWLDSAPDWILQKLENTVGSAKAPSQSDAKKTSTILAKKEESWRNLEENPDKWWDRRLKKSKPNAPDFKHKETGEGLWLDSRSTPKWVLDKFPPTTAVNQ